MNNYIETKELSVFIFYQKCHFKRKPDWLTPSSRLPLGRDGQFMKKLFEVMLKKLYLGIDESHKFKCFFRFSKDSDQRVVKMLRLDPDTK